VVEMGFHTNQIRSYFIFIFLNRISRSVVN